MTAEPAGTSQIYAVEAKPTPSYVTVTPDTARRWLEHNDINRRIRNAKVNQYASDMANGRWTFNTDAICFAPDGTLLNGQHRLSAVVASGATVTMLVLRNLPPGAMCNIDTGIVRSPRDAVDFEMRDETQGKNGDLISAAARLGILVTDGRICRDRAVQAISRGELIAFIKANPDLHASVSIASSTRKSIYCPASVLCVSHWMISRRNGSELANYFIRQLASRANEPEGSPILALDNRLRTLRQGKSKPPPRNYIWTVIKAWNYFATGRKVSGVTAFPKEGTKFSLPEVALYRGGLQGAPSQSVNALALVADDGTPCNADPSVSAPVSDDPLLTAAREVAADLTRQGKRVTRASLANELRDRGEHVSNTRAGDLARQLNDRWST